MTMMRTIADAADDVDVGPFLDKFSEPAYAAAFWTLVVSWIAYAVSKRIGLWAWNWMKTTVLGVSPAKESPDPKKLDERLRICEDSTGRIFTRLTTAEIAVAGALDSHTKDAASLRLAHETINGLSCRVRDLTDAVTAPVDLATDEPESLATDEEWMGCPLPELAAITQVVLDQISKAKLVVWKELPNEPVRDGLLTPNGLRISSWMTPTGYKLQIHTQHGEDITSLVPESEREAVRQAAVAKKIELDRIEVDRQRAEVVAAMTMPPVFLEDVVVTALRDLQEVRGKCAKAPNMPMPSSVPSRFAEHNNRSAT